MVQSYLIFRFPTAQSITASSELVWTTWDAYSVIYAHAFSAVILPLVGLAGVANDQNTIWTIALTDYVFVAGWCLFPMSETDRIQVTIRTVRGLTTWVAVFLFWLPVKILDVLNYLHVYKPANHIDTVPTITANTFHQCGEADKKNTAVMGGFVFYNALTGEVSGAWKEWSDVVEDVKRLRELLRQLLCRPLQQYYMPACHMPILNGSCRTITFIDSNVALLLKPSTWRVLVHWP